MLIVSISVSSLLIERLSLADDGRPNISRGQMLVLWSESSKDAAQDFQDPAVVTQVTAPVFKQVSSAIHQPPSSYHASMVYMVQNSNHRQMEPPLMSWGG